MEFSLLTMLPIAKSEGFIPSLDTLFGLTSITSVRRYMSRHALGIGPLMRRLHHLTQLFIPHRGNGSSQTFRDRSRVAIGSRTITDDKCCFRSRSIVELTDARYHTFRVPLVGGIFTVESQTADLFISSAFRTARRGPKGISALCVRGRSEYVRERRFDLTRWGHSC